MLRALFRKFTKPSYLFVNVSRKANAERNCLVSAYDSQKDQTTNTEVPLELGHAVVGNPGNRRRALAIEQYGRRMAEVDLLDSRLTQVIEAGAGRSFYGHGVFSPDAKLFYSVEITTDAREEGVLVVRDGRTFAPLGELPTHGRRPHDVVLLDGGRVLLIANQGAAHTEANGEPTSLAFVELATGKLLRKVEEPQTGLLFSHLAQNPGGDLAVALFHVQPKSDPESQRIRELLFQPSTRVEGAKRAVEASDFHSAPLYFVDKEAAHRHEPEPVFADMRMTLSVCLHAKRPVVGAVHVFGSLVTFSDARTHSLLASHKLDEVPQGVALTEDGAAFVVSTMGDSLYFFASDDFRLLKKIKPPTFQFGHHLLAWRTA